MIKIQDTEIQIQISKNAEDSYLDKEEYNLWNLFEDKDSEAEILQQEKNIIIIFFFKLKRKD